MVHLIKNNLIRTFVRNFSSALYITGEKAQTNYVTLIPHLDFEERIQRKSDLLANIQARNLNIDLDKIEKRWDFFRVIEDHKMVLDATKVEIANMIKDLKLEPEKNAAEIEKLILHAKLVKDEYKNVRDYSYGIEENAALAVLALPNYLHPHTPLDSEFLRYEFGHKPKGNSLSHMEIGKKLNLIDYSCPTYYFLKSEAALFEYATTNHFIKTLSKNSFVQFSNADFARSIILEGCGSEYTDQTKHFTLQDPSNDTIHDVSKLHLVGGGSLYAFMTYFTRNSVQTSYLPLKLFASGRNYKSVVKDAEADLFNVSQESIVKTFVACTEDELLVDGIFDDILDVVIDLYRELGYHFKIVYVPAANLHNSESLRVSIQMFSKYLQRYMEVGNLSIYGNYLSKRLQFTYNLDKDRKFVHVIAGDVLNVQKLLACALENSPTLLTDLLHRNL